MPVVIQSKTWYTGTVTPSALNTETTVVELGPYSDDFLVEGWLNYASLPEGASSTVRVYFALDGTNYVLYREVTVSRYADSTFEPVMRLHTMTLRSNMKVKVTVTQTAGTLASLGYWFVVEVLGTV